MKLKINNIQANFSDVSLYIGSDNGMVPPDNNPLPEPLLTQIYVAKWRH